MLLYAFIYLRYYRIVFKIVVIKILTEILCNLRFQYQIAFLRMYILGKNK